MGAQMARHPRILVPGILLVVPLFMTGCGGGGGGPVPDEPEASTTGQTTGEPCPDGLREAIEGAIPQGLVVTDVDPTTFSGPVGYEQILEGLPLSCVAQLTGPISYAYFCGGDETLVGELVSRIEIAGFAPLGENTSAGGYWVDDGGMLIAMVYSPDGADAAVPGSDDEPPIVGAGTSQPFVVIAFW